MLQLSPCHHFGYRLSIPVYYMYIENTLDCMCSYQAPTLPNPPVIQVNLNSALVYTRLTCVSLYSDKFKIRRKQEPRRIEIKCFGIKYETRGRMDVRMEGRVLSPEELRDKERADSGLSGDQILERIAQFSEWVSEEHSKERNDSKLNLLFLR